MNNMTRSTRHRYVRISPAGFSVMAGVAFAAAAVLHPAQVSADDVNVHPASCQAPFLDQAFPMRWHEYFVMNPTTGVNTWVICPVPFDNDDLTAGSTYTLRAEGGVMPGASTRIPVCIFSVHEASNLAQPGFINGNRLVFEANLAVTKTGGSWTGSGTAAFDNIANAIGPNTNEWGAAVRCLLPVGHSVSQIVLIGPN